MGYVRIKGTDENPGLHPVVSADDGVCDARDRRALGRSAGFAELAWRGSRAGWRAALLRDCRVLWRSDLRDRWLGLAGAVRVADRVHVRRDANAGGKLRRPAHSVRPAAAI